MKLNITTRGEAIEHGETLRLHLVKRAELALDRHADRVSSIAAVFEDLNGPRGGVDKRCRITVRGPEIGELVVEHVDLEWSNCIDGALDKTARVVVRQLERRRQSTRAPHRVILVENT